MALFYTDGNPRVDNESVKKKLFTFLPVWRKNLVLTLESSIQVRNHFTIIYVKKRISYIWWYRERSLILEDLLLDTVVRVEQLYSLIVKVHFTTVYTIVWEYSAINCWLLDLTICISFRHEWMYFHNTSFQFVVKSLNWKKNCELSVTIWNL